VAAVIAAGIIPAGLEMMDKPMTAAVEDYVHAGYDLDAEAILLCESDGTPEEVAEEIDRMLACCRLRRHAHGGQQGRGAAPEVLERAQERLPGQRAHQPRLHVHGLTIPRKRLADILLAIAEMEKKYGLRCCNVFHAGDGNLHPLILFDANDPDQLHRCELLRRRHPGNQRRAGRHRHRRTWRGRREAQQHVRAVQPRRARADAGAQACLRPSGMLNPGKVIPTLHRCAEYGSMHVKKGLLPFPGLERF
jgi:glycolate oxidase